VAELTTLSNKPLYNWAESSTYISDAKQGAWCRAELLAFATDHAKAVHLSHVVGFIREGNEAAIKIVGIAWMAKSWEYPRSNPNDIKCFYYVYAVPHE